MPSCALRYCKSRYSATTGRDYSLFSFPSVKSVEREKWIRFVQVDRNEEFWLPSTSAKLCSKHFRSEDIYFGKTGRSVLKKGSIPCIRTERPDGTEIELSDKEEGSVDYSDEDSEIHDSDNSDSLYVEANRKRARTESRIGSSKKSHQDIDDIDVEFDNIDKFGEQIAFLLKRIPRKLCRKLQDRIVTLVKTVTKKYEIKSKNAMPGTSSSSTSTKQSDTPIPRPVLSPTLGRYTRHKKDEQITIPEEAVPTDSISDNVIKECTFAETTQATQYIERDLGTDHQFTFKPKRIHKPMVLPIELMGSMDCIKQEVHDTEESDDIQVQYNKASIVKNSSNPLEPNYNEVEEIRIIKEEQEEEEEGGREES